MGKKLKLRKGQPAGARSASGRKRERTVVAVGPCEGVKRRRDLYRLPVDQVGEAGNDRQNRRRAETDTCDAIGRAYCAGLLGTGDRANDMLMAGRRLAAQYWIAYGVPTMDSLARFQPQDAKGEPRTQEQRDESDRIREQMLNDSLDTINKAGRAVRKYFDELVIDLNPDHGPAWLDRIVFAHRRGDRAREMDYAWLEMAKQGLGAIS
jgi:hypothetical protein